MPKIIGPSHAERKAAWLEFVNGFKRSRRGNLWRKYKDLKLTIFRRDGLFQSCVAKEGAPGYPAFSERGYATEKEALEGLADALGVE